MTCCLSFSARPGPINVAKSSPAEAVALELSWYLKPLPDTATIETSNWEVFPDSALTVSGETISGLATRVFVEAGEAGQLYQVTNTITVDDGQTLVQQFQVYVTAEPTIFIYT